jgi:hypothetical protein
LGEDSGCVVEFSDDLGCYGPVPQSLRLISPQVGCATAAIVNVLSGNLRSGHVYRLDSKLSAKFELK